MKDQDALSLGSVISLRTVSDGGALESERKPAKRPSSGSKKIKKSSGSPYGTPKKAAPKKTGREAWLSAVQNGGGMSAEGAGMSTWKFGKPNNLGNRTNASNYLLEQLTQTTSKAVRPSSATARVGGTGPVYKDAESYYDEIQALKRSLKQNKTEIDLLKAKNGRLQDENVAKSRTIEELLNPDMKNNDLRRTLTSKKPEASEVVMSLRRKIHKLEENLRRKENELRKATTDLKVTNIEEMRFENEMYLQEIQRLDQLQQENQIHSRENFISEDAINDALRDNKGNKATLLIKRLTDDNRTLVLENKSLQNDIMKLAQSGTSTGVNLDKDYEDMNRSELLQKIGVLEQRLKEEESTTLKNQNPKSEEEVDPEVIDDRCIVLKGPLPQQVKQLRERERELLGDVEKLESTIKKLKEDRSHYRKMIDEYRQQLESTSAAKEDNNSDTMSIKSEKSVRSPRKKSSVSTPRKSIEKPSPEISRSKENTRGKEKQVEELQERNAAKKIQRGWRKRQGQQQNVKNPKSQVYTDEADELEDDIVSVQSAWRGHQVRRQYLDNVKEEEEMLNDDDVLLIQSALRGHTARKEILNKTRASSRNKRSSNRYSNEIQAEQRYRNTYQNEEDDDDDDDDVVIGSSASFTKYRQPERRKPTSPRNPKIYSDPDARSYSIRERNQHSDENRKRHSRKNDMSEFLDNNTDDDYEQARDELSRRFQHDDEEREERPSNKTSINKLKSSSSPWQQSREIDDSEDDILSRSRRSIKSSDSRRSAKEAVDEDLQHKWARSGSKKKTKQGEERSSRKFSHRKSFQLEADDNDDDDDDIVVAPSFQKRLGSMATKRSNLDDELF